MANSQILEVMPLQKASVYTFKPHPEIDEFPNILQNDLLATRLNTRRIRTPSTVQNRT